MTAVDKPLHARIYASHALGEYTQSQKSLTNVSMIVDVARIALVSKIQGVRQVAFKAREGPKIRNFKHLNFETNSSLPTTTKVLII